MTWFKEQETKKKDQQKEKSKKPIKSDKIFF